MDAANPQPDHRSANSRGGWEVDGNHGFSANDEGAPYRAEFGYCRPGHRPQRKKPRNSMDLLDRRRKRAMARIAFRTLVNSCIREEK